MKVLLLCASHNDLGLIRALRKLGYNILVIGSISGQIGEKYADRYIQMDYSDKEAVLHLAMEEKIDAICQCCNDYGVYTAAYVAEKLNLPGYDSYETILTLHNKDRFKLFAQEHHILTPNSQNFSEVSEAEQYLKSVVYPQIVKPVDCSAGNGITKVNNYEEALEAVELAKSKSRAGRFVIEPFMIGSQHGFCTFLINEKVAAVSSNNEYQFLNPYRVEIDTFPADNYEKVSQFLIEQIEKIAHILHLKDGIFHLQYIMEGDKPYIIEVMRRVLGNMYSVPANMLNGFNWDYWETRAKCGLGCEHFPKGIVQEGYYAYKAIMAQGNGIIESIDIPSKYDKFLVDKCMLKTKGERIERYQSEPIGFLFFMFSSQEEMKHTLIEDYDNTLVTVNKNVM